MTGYTNRGIGVSGPPLRFNCSGETAVSPCAAARLRELRCAPGYLDDAVSQPSLLPGSAGTPDRSSSWPPWPRRCTRWAVPTPQRAWPTWSARYRVS